MSTSAYNKIKLSVLVLVMITAVFVPFASQAQASYGYGGSYYSSYSYPYSYPYSYSYPNYQYSYPYVYSYPQYISYPVYQPVYIPYPTYTTPPIYQNPTPVYPPVTYPPYTTPLVITCSAPLSSVITGSYVTWTANAFGGTGTYSYTWSGEGITSQRSNGITTYYTYPGTKTMTVSVSSGSEVKTQSCGTVIANYTYAN